MEQLRDAPDSHFAEDPPVAVLNVAQRHDFAVLVDEGLVERVGQADVNKVWQSEVDGRTMPPETAVFEDLDPVCDGGVRGIVLFMEKG